MAAPIRDKQANRRIRLLLGAFLVVFALMFARAFWLQGVEAAHLSALARNQHEETQTIPAGRGTIFDRTGVQLAIGTQKTTLYAGPEAGAESACDRARGARDARRRCECALPAPAEQEVPVRLHQALCRPGSGSAVPQEGVRGGCVLPRGAPHLSAGWRRCPGARFCRGRRCRARRDRAAVQPQARRSGRQADDCPRPDGARNRHDQLAPGAGGGRRVHHPRSHDPGSGGEGAA